VHGRYPRLRVHHALESRGVNLGPAIRKKVETKRTMNTRKHCKHYGLLIAILLTFNTEANELPEETTVISERVPDTSDTPWSIYSLDSNDLSFSPPEHIQQVLNTTPGMNIQRGNGMEYLPALRSPVLTGAGACGNLLVMEQGIRLRGAGVCNVNELFDAHYEQATSIEILRGTSSAFHGANSLLGVVDVRLDPSDEKSFSVDLGQRGFHRARFQHGYSTSTQQGTVYATFTDDSGWRDESGVEQQKLSWRHEAEIGSWQLEPGLTAINLNQETAGFITGENAYRDRALIKTNPTPEAYRDSKAGRLWVHAKRNFGRGSEVLVTPYFRHTDMAFLQHFLPGDPLENNRQTGLGLQSSVYQMLNSNWRLSYGADIEYSEAFLKQSQDAPTVGSAFLVATIPEGQHYNYDTEIYSAATFIQATGALTESLQLSTGLRAETIRYDYTNNLPTGRTRDDGSECGFGGCRYSRPESGVDTFQQLSPNIAIAYETQLGVLSASMGQNFRPPQTSELYRLQRQQNKADLDNVETNYFNVAFERKTEDFEFRLDAYYQDIDNLIIRDVDFFNVDNAKAESTGIELTWTQNFGSLRSSLVLNWADHQYGNNQIIGRNENGDAIDVSGNNVDTAPSLFGQWQLAWQATKHIETQVTVEYSDDYYLEPLNEHRYDGHTLFHWSAAWAVHSSARLRLKVNNVFDTRYASRADYTGFSGYRYFPGEPRTVFIGFDFKY